MDQIPLPVHDGAMIAIRILAGMALFTAAACSNTVSSLSYNPPPSVQQALAPRVAGIEAIDQRREQSHRIATIMGGYGNPLKTLDTTKPVKDEVADAFTKGLRARNLLADTGGPLRMIVTIRKFDADMIMGSTARIDLTAVAVDSAGRNVFEQTVTDSTSDFAFFKTGMFADIADLQRMCQVVLDRTVDKVLDAPAFRLAVGPAGPQAEDGRGDPRRHLAALTHQPAGIATPSAWPGH